MTATKKCDTCLYHNGKKTGSYCHRYPVAVHVKLTHWCGEWRPGLGPDFIPSQPRCPDVRQVKASFNDVARDTILLFVSSFTVRGVWNAMPKAVTRERKFHSGRASIQRQLRKLIDEGLVKVESTPVWESIVYKVVQCPATVAARAIISSRPE